MMKSPTCAQGHAFQAHSLQIILLGPFAYEPNVIHGSLQIVSLHEQFAQIESTYKVLCLLFKRKLKSI